MNDLASVQDKLKKLKERYVKSLPEKIADICYEWDLCKTNRDISSSDFASHLHKLAGSAGMYEFSELGEIARTLELITINAEDRLPDEIITEINTHLSQLKLMINALT